MINVRKTHAVFGNAQTHIEESGNDHCFAFSRKNSEGETLLVMCNFSEQVQIVDPQLVADRNWRDLLTDASPAISEHGLSLKPFQQLWLSPTP